MNLDNTKFVIEYLQDLYFSSKSAHTLLFKEIKDTHETRYNNLDEKYREDRQEIVAAILLNKAISVHYSLKAFYYSNYSELEDYRIDNVLTAFVRFSNEFLTSVATKHSYQYTDIYYESLKEALAELIQIHD